MKKTFLLACLVGASCATVQCMDDNTDVERGQNERLLQQRQQEPQQEANRPAHKSGASKAGDLCVKGLFVGGISFAATVIGVTLYNVAHDMATDMATKN